MNSVAIAAARRVPFWPMVALAVVAWIIAWFITLPLAEVPA